MTSNGADALCGDSVAIAPALVVEPMETLQRLLLGECRGGLKRNSSYLQDLQRDGMLASWRQKMSRWMFEVLPGSFPFEHACSILRSHGTNGWLCVAFQ